MEGEGGSCSSQPSGGSHRQAERTRSADCSPQIAHTLAACNRCRQRKSRCDPGLPRCKRCEQHGEICAYFDAAKGRTVRRDYVVHLQEKVQARESELKLLETEQPVDEGDEETMVREAGAVKIAQATESKYLGPSSGIAMTRLVMRLAKQFTANKSIKDVISDAKARKVKDRLDEEQAKPTSKIYPLISNFAATELPDRGLADALIRLYIAKVQYMYPVLHEPTFANDVEAVYGGSVDPYQNFVVRMVIAISMQKIDTEFAGLADSYYLAALAYLEPCVKLMSLKTLQCYALIAEYATVTPTRTALFYVVGLATRLCQILGFTDEKTLVVGKDGQKLDPLEIDMRRRMFWITMNMEYGLAHVLGRPAAYATRQEHINVGWFEAVDDRFIKADGLLPGPLSTKKWIAIHFTKMRMLGLEIRRKLYLRKRAEPKDDSHPWFQKMEEKLYKWKHESPNNDEGSGLSTIWFEGRLNTMIIMLFRPTPQVPSPSVQAAIKCYNACEYNIYMQRNQLQTSSVALTWQFAQTIFSNLNAMLWSLSYSKIRELHPREDVERHLRTCLDCLQLASQRWPGVESAIELYDCLIEACLKSYERADEIQLSASSPSTDLSSLSYSEPAVNSTTESPEVRSSSISPNLEFGYVFPNQANGALAGPASPEAPFSYGSPGRGSMDSISDVHYAHNVDIIPFDPKSPRNALPNDFGDIVHWNPAYTTSSIMPGITSDMNLVQEPIMPGPMNDQYIECLNQQYWGSQAHALGILTEKDQRILLQNLETQRMADIMAMIQDSAAAFNEPMTYPNYQT